VRAPEGRTTAVWMHFTGCYDRGLRTVDGQSQVTQSFLEAVMRPLGSGWSFSSDLPQ